MLCAIQAIVYCLEMAIGLVCHVRQVVEEWSRTSSRRLGSRFLGWFRGRARIGGRGAIAGSALGLVGRCAGHTRRVERRRVALLVSLAGSLASAVGARHHGLCLSLVGPASAGPSGLLHSNQPRRRRAEPSWGSSGRVSPSCWRSYLSRGSGDTETSSLPVKVAGKKRGRKGKVSRRRLWESWIATIASGW